MMIHYAWIIAFTGTLVLLLTQGFARMSYSVILPSMKDGLLLTYTQIGLIGTANFIGYLTLAVVGGFLDTTGTFTEGFILSGIVSLVGAAASMLLRRKT